MKILILVVALLVLAAAGPEFLESVGAQSTPVKPATSGVTAPELDRLLGPIALYPDQLLAQMLICAAEPAKVTELNTWLMANATLKGTTLQDEATIAGFEPSFIALTLFPQVVRAMAEQLDSTTRLGRAFASDRTAVFDSIQRLRKNAHASGALKSNAQQAVETKTVTGNQQVIVIEPANPQIVYVPQYNPQVIYTQPPTTTVVVEKDDDSDAAVAALIGFTAGIAIGAAVDNNYYYGPYGWHGGVHMYNDAWDDWADDREDAREDWMDHREDLVEERGERASDAREQRTERSGETQEQRTERAENRQGTRADSAAAPRTEASSYESRGKTREADAATKDRSGTRSDAFSGYSSGQSERASSARGQRSRSTSRGGGGGGRRR